MNEGFITLHRKLLEWEWYDDIPTHRVFLHLLLKANYKDEKWRGILIKRGERLTSLAHLAAETSLTVKQVRLSLEKLQKTKEVDKRTTSQYTIITLNKYNDYQTEGKQDGKGGAKKGQAGGKRGATNNKDNKGNNTNNKKEVVIQNKFILWILANAPRVQKMESPITADEAEKLVKDFDRKRLIKIFLAMHNRKDLLKQNVSANLTARNWMKREKPDSATSEDKSITVF